MAQPVQLGRSDGKRVEVLQGLQAGGGICGAGGFVVKSELGKPLPSTPIDAGATPMFEKLIRAAIEHRWLVLLAAIGMAAVGVFSYQKLPIDAVPDITNVQCRSIPRRRAIHRWRPNSG